MLRQAQSKTLTRNPAFNEQPRRSREDNLTWGTRAARDMNTSGPDNWTYIALLGGTDTSAFRIRSAQSILRRDMLPSFWSEAILVKLASASLMDAQATYVPLVQPEGPTYSPFENGVISQPLELFKDIEQYPNIALIALPVPQENIMRHMETFKRSRSTLDALEHVLRWLAYTWGVARTTNPLHENYGLPSACMLETVCAAEDFDLTPGLESRASCPEAIWSAAIYWHEYYAKTGDGQKVPYGRYSIGHAYSIVEPEQRSATTPNPPEQRTPNPRKPAKKSRR
jgi:hypothetical protein